MSRLNGAWHTYPVQVEEEAFRGHGGVEAQLGVGAEGFHAFAEGEEDADAVHQRRLADRLGAERAIGVVLRLQELHGHVVGHEVDVRGLVGGQGVGEAAPFGVPTAGLPWSSRPMPWASPPLHLAAVHGGIDGAAEVVDDLHLVDGVGAAQAVDGDLEHGAAVDVVGKRAAVLALLVVVDARAWCSSRARIGACARGR